MNYEDAEREAFVKITELIGEMSFGIGVPLDIKKEKYVIFDAIYQKLRNNKDYQPYQRAREKEMELYRVNCMLRDKIEMLNDEIAKLRSKL